MGADEPKSEKPTSQKVRWILLFCVVGWLVFTLLNASRGRWISASIDLAVVVGTWFSRQLAVRSERREVLASHLACAWTAMGLTVVSMIQGQTLAMASWYLVAAPTLAGHLIGEFAAKLWTAIVVVLLGVVHLSSLFVRITPEFVHEPQEVWLGAATLAVMQLGFAVASLRAQQEDIASILHREQVIRSQAEELVKARDEALAGARAKDEFLAVMSHEIRTPLNGVLGMAEALSMSNLSSEHREQLEVIRSSGEALRVIIDDVLDTAKIDAGMISLEAANFSIVSVLGTCKRLLRPMAEKKGLSLDVSIAEEVPEYLHGDAHRIQQVVMNLVGNALKFTERGSVSVLAELEEMKGGLPGSKCVHVMVRDTGIGISEEDLGKLFQPFSQVDHSAGRRYQGTGLGLAISRKLARLMGGEVWAESSLGKGSTFHFSFPLVLANGVAAVSETNAGVREFSVLVVEDDEINRRVAAAIFPKLGHECSLVSSGAEALALFDKSGATAPEVVFMDMSMPGMDGMETTRKLRALQDTIKQPWIIALTANARASDREKCLAAGMNDFVSKPFSMASIQAALGRVPTEPSSRWKQSA